jgi:hypothetical protein
MSARLRMALGVGALASLTLALAVALRWGWIESERAHQLEVRAEQDRAIHAQVDIIYRAAVRLGALLADDPAGARAQFGVPIPRLNGECGASGARTAPLDPRWEILGVADDYRHGYAYEYEVADGASVDFPELERVFTFRAVGDLDCDGVTSIIEVAGGWDAHGAVQTTLAPYYVMERE